MKSKYNIHTWVRSVHIRMHLQIFFDFIIDVAVASLLLFLLFDSITLFIVIFVVAGVFHFKRRIPLWRTALYIDEALSLHAQTLSVISAKNEPNEFIDKTKQLVEKKLSSHKVSSVFSLQLPSRTRFFALPLLIIALSVVWEVPLNMPQNNVSEAFAKQSYRNSENTTQENMVAQKVLKEHLIPNLDNVDEFKTAVILSESENRILEAQRDASEGTKNGFSPHGKNSNKNNGSYDGVKNDVANSSSDASKSILETKQRTTQISFTGNNRLLLRYRNYKKLSSGEN